MQAMLDQLIQGCAIFDAAHRLGAWNGQLQQLLKLSDAELAGAPTFERFIRRQAERGDFGTAAESVEAAVREHLDALETTYLAERMLSDGRIVEVGRVAAENGIDCDFVQGGTLSLARGAVQLGGL